MHTSVVGLGKLGAPLAAILAEHGHHVVGVDRDRELVDLLNAGRTSIREPGLDDMLARNSSRLRGVPDICTAVADTEITFVVVPTPSTPSGAFSSSFVLSAIDDIGKGLDRKKGYHVVVVTSTVMPTSMEKEIRPALEAASGRIVGDTVGLCYNPEFIALGSVLHDMTHPDIVLIGESDPRAGDMLEAAHRSFIADTAQVRRMGWVNAEIAKIAINTFVTTKISYANMLAELCERVPGGDVDVVTDTIGFDRRIGHRYLRGGVGYGGPCFPRDNAALAAAATLVGAHAELPAATDSMNRRQIERIADIVRAHATPGQHRIGVLGLSYKPDTPVVVESQGVMVANRLAQDRFAITAFDPAALSSAESVLSPSIARAASLAECLDASDVVVLMVPWADFKGIPAMLRQKPRRPVAIVDCWRMLAAAELDGVAELLLPGKATTR